jgi:cyanophycinase
MEPRRSQNSQRKLSTQSHSSKGPLVIIGGAEDKVGECAILRSVVELAGGTKAHFSVITCASEFPNEVGEEYHEVFKRFGAKQIDILSIDSRDNANSKEILKQLKRASCVFFTGGCQLRISNLLGGTATETLLKRRHKEGLLIAGTSAGAAIMSDMMIVAGESQSHPSAGVVELGYGLGFLPRVVVDQHFAQRGRLGRLLSAVAQHPGHVGLGIDENTAVVAHKNELKVLGSGAVTIVDTHTSNFSNLLQQTSLKSECLALWNIRLHVLPKGYGFHMLRLEVLQPSSREPIIV